MLSRKHTFRPATFDLPLALFLFSAVLGVWPAYDRSLCWNTLGALVAVLVDLRFCRDGSLLRSLHLLPLLWILEPAAAVVGAFGRTVRWRGRRYRLRSGRATLLHP